MPSLHFGNSFLVGGTLFLFAPHRIIRILAPLWPLAMFTTITATANHYVLDAAVGACIPLVAWRLNRVLLNLRPLEEWGFWLCRAEKPPRASGKGRYALREHGSAAAESYEAWIAGARHADDDFDKDLEEESEENRA